MALTPKQAEFCRQYLLDLNATQAAVRAGYSARTANEQAARLLANVSVKAEVARLQAERADRTALDADWVVRRLREEANDRGLSSSHSARVRALELLGKHLSMFVDRHEHTGKDGGPIQLTAEQRAEAVAAILAQASARLNPPADPAG